MMPDTVLGVPLHPLVVHAVVVFVPLAALGTIAVAVVPRWRSTYGWLVVLVSTLALASVPVATRSGADLRSQLTLGGPVLEQVRRHAQLGERLIYAVAPLWLLGVALVLLHRDGRHPQITRTVAVLAALAALPALVLVVLVGHLGSAAVWGGG